MLDTECTFPFNYNGVRYLLCTEIDSPGKPWCSDTFNVVGDDQKKYCILNDDCYYPFMYQDKIYHQCTTHGSLLGRPWCPKSGIYHSGSEWVYCDSHSYSLQFTHVIIILFVMIIILGLVLSMSKYAKRKKSIASDGKAFTSTLIK